MKAPTAGTSSAPGCRSDPAVLLIWLPLGAGQPIVRFSGRCYERFQAWRHARPPLALYHAALEVTTPTASYAIELAPVPDANGSVRGVVCEGPVGTRWLGRLRCFRYELRCWPEGTIPDRDLAVARPTQLTIDPVRIERLLAVMPTAPTPVWGRDELHLGEMWNSNAVIAWLLTVTGMLDPHIGPPPGGRAPGWDAGIRLAERAAT